jgi:hypothetical protein
MAQPSGRDRLAGLLGDVRAATAFRYDARDSAGNRMDTAKVIASPAGGYLAVYHSGQVCHLATSTDLMQWTHQAVIDQPATQPTIAATGDGGLLTAAEFNDGQGGQLRIRYLPTLDALLAGRPARQFLAPRTLSACNEGTPSVRQLSLDASRIELGLHYHRACQVDPQARGTLTGFRAWTAATDPELDAAVERAAAAAGEQIGGNIGDRDHLRYRGRDYDLVEAQSRRGDFASWRVYLYDRAAGTAQRLTIVTHGGEQGVCQPDGDPAARPGGPPGVHGDPICARGGRGAGRGRLAALPHSRRPPDAPGRGQLSVLYRYASAQTPSSFPLGSVKWNRRPPGNSYGPFTTWPPAFLTASTDRSRSVEYSSTNGPPACTSWPVRRPPTSGADSPCGLWMPAYSGP